MIRSFQSYSAYKPSQFTPAERPNVTILFGGLHWRAERALQGILENCGCNAQPLPPVTRDDLAKGQELADIGQCCPSTFTTGNLVNYLLKEVERSGVETVIRDYIYLTAGSCGACRFGQYHQSYELALRNIGMEKFRLFIIDQKNLDQSAVPGGGLQIDAHLLLGMVLAILCTDVIQDLEYQVRPYELEQGATDRAVWAVVEEIYEAMRLRPWRCGKWRSFAWHLTTNYFVQVLRQARRHFDAIEVDRLRVKPKVKITGELYLQTVESEANHQIHRWLESEGAEIYPAALAILFDYLVHFAAQEFEDQRGVAPSAGVNATILNFASWLIRMIYNRLRTALLSIPRPLPNQNQLRQLAAPYYNEALSGGEGYMLIGKVLWTHLRRKAHMICELSPYGCMPNTMSQGAIAAALGNHPDLLYAPLEIRGDNEVHVFSRCQMILTDAKARAQQEFDSALSKTGLSLTEIQRRLRGRPEMQRALWRVPHHGAVGTAANVVLELGEARL